MAVCMNRKTTTDSLCPLQAVSVLAPDISCNCWQSLQQRTLPKASWMKLTAEDKADLNWFASIILLVDLVKDEAIILVALCHVSPHCKIDKFAKLFQNHLSCIRVLSNSVPNGCLLVTSNAVQ